MEPLKPEFREMLAGLLGIEEAAELVSSLDTPPPAAIRLNPAKRHAGICQLPMTKSVGWCQEDGFVLSSRPNYALIPQWHGGAFYVQEPASMALASVARFLKGTTGVGRLRWLDLCAAPGGKTTAILSALSPHDFVVANEYDSRRVAILSENLTKWGYPNVAVTTGDTSKFRRMREAFHVVSVDAPCSGEGMMRKEDEARRQWSPQLVSRCATLQKEILSNAWEALAPGGYLIYSTCTFNRWENEDNVRWMTEEFGAENPPLPEWRGPVSLDPDINALRFMPHVTQSEGLFIALLRKPGELIERESKILHRKKTGAVGNLAKISGWINHGGLYLFEADKDGGIAAIPSFHADLIRELRRNVGHLPQVGIYLGTVKNKDIIPSHSLAMSIELSPDSFPTVELTEEEALDYLRRGTEGASRALKRNNVTDRGYVTVTHGCVRLGFIKNIDNRINNLYPAQWRLRVADK